MATNTHTEVPGGQKGAFPPFNATTFASQLVWLAITFAFLFIVMSKIALPRVGGIIENRQKKISGDLADAEKLKTESDEALASYEKALADARARAQGIANETRDRQAAETEARRKTLEDELNVKLVAAEKTITANKQAAMANVQGIATDTAKAIVAQLIGTAPNDQAAEAAVRDALKG